MSLTTHWSQIERLHGRTAPDAWQWFIDRYRDFVAAALRRLIWAPDRAAAASEEFWGYLFQCGVVERMPRPSCFRALLVSTVRNYAREWMRQNPRQPHRNDDPADLGPLLPEDLEVTLWARHLLQLALRRLDRGQPRQAEILRSFYGLPQSADAEPVTPRSATAIAASLGCKPNALYQLLHRARTSLRECVLDEVRQTVDNDRDLATEFEVLMAALGHTTPGIVGEETTPGAPA